MPLWKLHTLMDRVNQKTFPVSPPLAAIVAKETTSNRCVGCFGRIGRQGEPETLGGCLPHIQSA
jgi:hypothetical protein